ncbi:autotransporter domain-containing protein [Roseobacter sp. HKCCD9010]|nr:autotransporter domain-containing protein [Rhodobacterales bacterium HKCCD4356]NNV14486.1 autotransporter domain-containing protein [Roseobacter sp. HKCCD7357]NNV18746.1 autotransporter domain-containing protein [Roseobacter sp. HKCCD8768]NNV28196.1 autotransporter domain-containing protein [Roseobacter sp. HKCCD8192]NNV32472.1 autotransporter domain-containing protein [Roseobacter sp. HKCCD9061]NNV36728.1 autotransporter domain-containing protein [Roseobacter sp. HKCCD9073]NNV41008.1 auto
MSPVYRAQFALLRKQPRTHGVRTAGFFAGLDTQNPRGWQVGLFAGYGNSSVTVGAREASGDANSFTLGGYTGYQINDFDFRFGASHAWHKVTTDRTVTVDDFHLHQITAAEHAVDRHIEQGKITVVLC